MEHLKPMIKAARAAGKIILQNFGKVEFGFKQDGTHVSIVDKSAEEAIKKILKKAFPAYGFIGEEGGTEKGKSEYTWVVDSLDGTTNYKIGFPFFCTSIGLAKGGEPVAAVIFAPMLGELFSAEKGKGAFLNGKPIWVGDKVDFKKAIIGFCHGQGGAGFSSVKDAYCAIKPKNTHIRQFGSAATELAYVAAGRIDAFFMGEMNSYDVAAGVLLVQEAGGKVTDFSGKKFTLASKDVVATNSRLHSSILGFLKD